MIRCVGLATCLAAAASGQAPDRVLFDFEVTGLEKWRVEGEAFGRQPAIGALPGQQPVSGFCGRHLVNSFVGGDAAVGRLLSPEFEITHRRLRFFVGGGDDHRLVVRLRVGDDVAFEATGHDGEVLRPVTWDLHAYRGRQARLELLDDATGPWGHLTADHFVLTDDLLAGPPLSIGPRRHIYVPPAAPGAPRFALNDHCFVRDDKGGWHLFAILFTEPGTPQIDGRLFAHATAPALTGPWQPEPNTLEIDPAAGETRLWAPHVVRHAGRFWMCYHAGGADERRSLLHLATSTDLQTWRRHAANPIVVDGFQARDPFLLRGGDRWWLYYTATFPAAGGHHTVAVRSSRDLVGWSDATEAYRDPSIGTDFGPTESPFVVVRGEYAWLFVGSSVPAEYDTTRVFRSRDATSWAPGDLVATLRVHGTELVRDAAGRWYASHAGDGRGGLWLARVYWNDGLDDDGQPVRGGR